MNHAPPAGTVCYNIGRIPNDAAHTLQTAMPLIDNPSGGYRFLSGITPYSAGVVAAPGFQIVRATLQSPLPYQRGFEILDRSLASQGRPRAALCAVELRAPRPWSFDGFAAFNAEYIRLLDEWGLLLGGHNPIARTNVAPEAAAPASPALYAFSYTIPLANPSDPPTFVVAGAGELPEGVLAVEAIVRPGETTAEAMDEKAAFVFALMHGRLTGLGANWVDVTAIDLYTVRLPLGFLQELPHRIGAASLHGFTWHTSRPPIEGLEFEMDLRGVRQELRIGA